MGFQRSAEKHRVLEFPKLNEQLLFFKCFFFTENVLRLREKACHFVLYGHTEWADLARDELQRHFKFLSGHEHKNRLCNAAL